MNAYLKLMRFDRPVGIWLLLWHTLWAIWIASAGHLNLLITVIFILGVVVMRAAGCVANDLADQALDRQVERTRTRPLAAGTLSRRKAYQLLGVLCVIAFFLVLCTNKLTILLAPVGLGLALLYPWMKRITHFPQFFLGLAWGLS